MKLRALIVNIVLLVLLANTSIAQTVNESREWEAVKAVAPGERLSVRLKDGKKIDGTLRTVSETQLALLRGTTARDLNRETIARVHHVVRRSMAGSIGKSTAMGAAIGFGVGAGVGVVGGTYEDLDTASLVGFLGGFGTAIGAGIGALVGAVYVKRERVLLYEAK